MDKKRTSSVREQIKAAMSELLNEKQFSHITVTDLIKTAGVARASFYRNYSSTTEVLDEMIDELISEFSHKVLPVITSDDRSAWRDLLFEYIYRVRINHDIFESTFNLNISDIFSRINEKIQILENSQTYSTIPQKYGVAAKLGVISSVLKHWIDTGMKESPEELVSYLMSFIVDI